MYFLKKSYFFLILEFCPETFRTSGKKFLQGFKAAFNVSWENYSGEVFNFQKKWKQFRFFSKNVDLRQQKLSTLVKTAFHVSNKKRFEEEYYFYLKIFQLFYRFHNSNKNLHCFRTFGNFYRQSCQNCIPTVQVIIWRPRFFSKKIILIIIWLFHRRISSFRWIMYGNFVKTSFYVSRGSYLGEIFMKKK